MNKAYGLLIFSSTLISYFVLTGFEINKSTRKFRKIVSAFGFSAGKWKELPTVNYVTVVAVRITRKNLHITGTFVEIDNGDKDFIVNLIVNDNTKYITLFSLDKEPAIKLALEIGEFLNTKVLDFTTPDEKWIR